MNRGELVTEIRNKLGYNTGLSASIITLAIDNAQRELEETPELPWFLESEMSSISTESGEERVPVPSDFLMETNENLLYYYDATASQPWVPLYKKDAPLLRNTYKDSTAATGAPQAFTLQGKYFRIFPTPDAIYTLKMVYYGREAVLTSDSSTNNWSVEVPYALVGKAGLSIAMNNRDKGAIAIFDSLFKAAMTSLRVRSEAREHAGQTYQRGGED